MHMSSKAFKGSKDKRESGLFVALPYTIIKSTAYRDLSYSARSLLIDIAMQYTSSNNGRLVACNKFLKPLEWTSHGTITNGLKELIACGLLIQTRLGMRPNRAAWFALAWYDLDESNGIEVTKAQYQSLRTEWKLRDRNTLLIPKIGIGKALIAPKFDHRASTLAPKTGVIQ